MFTTLKNEYLSIQVNEKGAELSSLVKKDESYEYIWQGDAKYWTGRSPVLFPIVGSLKNGKSIIEGQDYSMGNHGLARHSIFELVDTTKTSMTFSLKYSDESLKAYPYKFELLLKYTLIESSVRIDYFVKNHDDKEIYFQIGTHPAFNCPTGSDYSLSDYQLVFNEGEDIQRESVTAESLLYAVENERLVGKTLNLSEELFLESACIYRGINSSEITLKSDKDPRFVKVSFEKLPYLGVWQPPHAPFLCIEPWHGITENAKSTGRFADKEMLISLPVGKEHNCSITIEV